MAYNTNTTGQAAKVAAGTTVTGSRASPVTITAAGGITPGGYSAEVMFVKSNGGSGGSSVAITKNPQIAVGTAVGQTLMLIGTDDAHTFYLQDGNGVYAGDAALTEFASEIILTLTWTGLIWANIGNLECTDAG